jgi:FkbM family methyltransferase
MKLVEYLKEIARILKYRGGKKFYGETGEDAVVSQIFGNQKGYFIDIGASHPIIGNNTYALYRIGWQGIAVEPLRRFQGLWKVARPRDVFHLKVISSSSDPVEFVEFGNSLLSSSNQSTIDAHIRRGLAFKRFEVETVRLADLLPLNLRSSEPFLLSIDVEGSEEDVLTTIDFSRQRPRVILVESWGLPWDKKSEAIEYLEKAENYALFAYTGLTAVMVPNEVLKEIRGLRAELEDLS